MQALLLVACALLMQSEPPGEPLASAPPIAVTVAVEGGQAAAEGRPLEARLGEPRVLELSATAPRDAVLFPPLLPAVGTFELGNALPGSEKASADTITTTWRWQILPVRLGVEKIPAIELPYRTADGQQGIAVTPIVRVMVRGHLENDQDPALGQAPPPVDVITTNWALIWALSVGGALVFAALATWLVLIALRQRFEALKPPPPPRPADEVARERLDAIDRLSGAELDGAERLARTIDALREYLGGRYRIDALEMTTPELERVLPSLDLKAVAPDAITRLLAEADLVKFARLMPPEDEARALSPVVRNIVEATWESPVEETPELIRREPASVRQRVYAGLVDGLLAGVIGLIAMGFLWVIGAIELGFLALILVGVLLALRDAFARSPGKVLLRLAIVTRDEAQSAPSAGRRMKRNAILLLWPLAAPLEWLVLRQHPLALRVGDIWAETEVVRHGDVAVPVAPRPAQHAEARA